MCTAVQLYTAVDYRITRNISDSWRTLAAKAEGEYGSHDRFCLVSGKCPEPESEQEARGPARKRAKKELAWARTTEWACNPHLNPMCFLNAAVNPSDANVAMSDAGGLFFQAADGARQGVVPQGWLRLYYGDTYWVLPVGDARSPTASPSTARSSGRGTSLP